MEVGFSCPTRYWLVSGSASLVAGVAPIRLELRTAPFGSRRLRTELLVRRVVRRAEARHRQGTVQRADLAPFGW